MNSNSDILYHQQIKAMARYRHVYDYGRARDLLSWETPNRPESLDPEYRSGASKDSY